MFSETRYAMNGDLHVAYRASREGPRDIVFVPNWFTCCEILPELASLQRRVEAMTSLGRLIFFDQPGTVAPIPSRRTRCRPWSNGPTASPPCSTISEVAKRSFSRCAGALPTERLFAATHPSRTAALVVQDGFADTPGTRNDGFDVEDFISGFNGPWRTGEFQHAINPDMPWNEEIRAAWARQDRMAASRDRGARAPADIQLDVRPVLPTIRVPTLVLHHADDQLIPPAWGEYVADHIPGAKYVELPGRNVYHFIEPWRDSTGAGRLPYRPPGRGGRRSGSRHRALHRHRRLDALGSRARRPRWHALLDAHDAIVRSHLARFRGREVNTSGDGFLATFDGPQRAIRCAIVVRDAVQPLGIEVRAGLHTGECEVRGDDIGGIAVHIGARVTALAGPTTCWCPARCATS